MTVKERQQEIFELGHFNPEEIEKIDATIYIPNSFKSIEYHLLIHMTDAELYYCSDDFTSADLQEDTPKGIVYGFK